MVNSADRQVHGEHLRGRTDAAMLLFALSISANLRTRGTRAERRVGLCCALWQMDFVREPHNVRNIDR